MGDFALILGIVGIGCLVLFVGALIADAWDESERRDAYRRNKR